MPTIMTTPKSTDPASHSSKVLAHIVTAVDLAAEGQGASTHRGYSRQYDLALEALEIAEWRMRNAVKLEGFFTDANHWDEPNTDTDTDTGQETP